MGLKIFQTSSFITNQTPSFPHHLDNTGCGAGHWANPTSLLRMNSGKTADSNLTPGFILQSNIQADVHINKCQLLFFLAICSSEAHGLSRLKCFQYFQYSRFPSCNLGLSSYAQLFGLLAVCDVSLPTTTHTKPWLLKAATAITEMTKHKFPRIFWHSIWACDDLFLFITTNTLVI